ncbi:TetR/AcrR family transcriptional regulator [Nocardia sp. 348MFTsu5.1]|uniref:TetR/AcrR family transcriptional regulator n=1 Tax=Nocardia sp. 348MFTsu5.1 TaxID=1172185 RepID=UPI00035C24F4|nr:TetR/AcrR family transcriptional regulator [Nocardia sp. 348MFTsu5.1]
MTRKTRIDKQENREKILRIALRHFKKSGINASLDAIAKDAEIGSGTLYRHFPTREDLIAALLELRDSDTIARIEEIGKMPDAGAQLDDWLNVLENYLDTFNGLADPLGKALAGDDSPLAVSCDWLISTTGTFLQRAQNSGYAQPDLTGRDLFLVALATTWIKRSAAADDVAVSTVKRIIGRGIAAGTPLQ